MASQSSRAYFEQQRESLVSDIAANFEKVLANINKLNRNLEAVITVGNEFSAVEALWSQFENVMVKEPESESTGVVKPTSREDSTGEEEDGGDEVKGEDGR